MKKRLYLFLLFYFMLTTTVYATGNDIEIFDIDEGEVVKSVEMTQLIYDETEQMIEHITDVYQDFKPIPDEGFMVKVPLEKPIHVYNEWLNQLVEETIVIFPENEQPHLMIFDAENEFHIFTFEYDTEKFLDALDYWPFDD